MYIVHVNSMQLYNKCKFGFYVTQFHQMFILNKRKQILDKFRSVSKSKKKIGAQMLTKSWCPVVDKTQVPS